MSGGECGPGQQQQSRDPRAGAHRGDSVASAGEATSKFVRNSTKAEVAKAILDGKKGILMIIVFRGEGICMRNAMY